jgi:hypothetical protein
MLCGSCATFCRRALQCWEGGGGPRAIAAAVVQFLCTEITYCGVNNMWLLVIFFKILILENERGNIYLIVCSMNVVSCCFSLFDVEAWLSYSAFPE